MTTSPTEALRRVLDRRDGRGATGRELAGALGLQEREVHELLSAGRRDGWVETAGKTPRGATLYRRVSVAAAVPPTDPTVDEA